MKDTVVWGLLLFSISAASCGPAGPARGEDLAAGWEVLRNYSTDQGSRFEAELTLTNQGPGVLPATGWSLYFNTLAGIQPIDVPPTVELIQVNGGFYRLRPAAGFESLSAGESASWKLTFPGWSVSEGDAPSGIYIVYQDGEGAEQEPQPLPPIFVRPFVTEAQTRRNSMDRVRVPTPELRYELNANLSMLSPAEFSPIIPTPVWLQAEAGEWVLSGETEIHYGPELEFEAQYLAAALEPLLGRAPGVAPGREQEPNRIVLKLGHPFAPAHLGAADQVAAGEAYRVRIAPDRGVEIEGASTAGVFYGVQSFRALLPVDAYVQPQDEIRVAAVQVEDAPRFGYRGMHLDVARNFQPKSQVLRFLDLMAFYKLNRFHFHFTDDEGWRWAVDGLPELTEVGGRRGHTLDEHDRLVPSYGSGPFPDPNLSSGSGYYSRQDLIEILRYAHQRHIEVIPEIDAPGHARAAIVAMKAREARLRSEQQDAAAEEFRLVDPNDESTYRSVQGWNDNVVDVCQESTFRFLGKVFDELKAVFEEAGAPLQAIHIGGDEVPSGVWEHSPACRQLIESAASGVSSLEDLPHYFVRRLSDLLAERGLKTAGWEEIALQRGGDDLHGAKAPNPEFAGSQFQVYAWNSIWGESGAENAYRLANAGYPVVLCNASNLYLDLAYNKDPQELGQAWAGYVNTHKAFEFVPMDYYKSARQDFFGNSIDPASLRGAARLTPSGSANILGIQGQLWSEVLTNPGRMEYMAFPKLLGLAERAWSSQPNWARIEDREESDRLLALAWNRFANALGQRELTRLDHLDGGIQYRIPLPGAVIGGGELRANVAFPGLQIRFTTDGSEPDADSTLYEGPIEVSGIVKLKTFNTRGRGSRTSTPH